MTKRGQHDVGCAVHPGSHRASDQGCEEAGQMILEKDPGDPQNDPNRQDEKSEIVL